MHYLHRPTLVHQLKERTGKVYTSKCGAVTDSMEGMTGWQHMVTCDACSPIRKVTS